MGEGALESGNVRARWCPSPSLERHCVPDGIPSVGTWECRIGFENVLVPREDLARGDLARLTVTAANS